MQNRDARSEQSPQANDQTRRIAIQSVYDPTGLPEGYARAIRAGDLVFVSGHLAADINSGMATTARTPDHLARIVSRGERETDYLLEKMNESLLSVGSSVKSLVSVATYATDIRELSGSSRARLRHYDPDTPPTSAGVEIAEHLCSPATVMMDAIASAGGSAQPIGIDVDTGPAPPYQTAFGAPVHSDAIKAGPFVFTAGKCATIAGKLAPQVTPHPEIPHAFSAARRQTEFILQYFENVLSAAGTSLDRTVRAEVHLADPSALPALNAVWRRMFPENRPALAIIPVTDLVPPGALMEISLIALAGDSDARHEVISGSGAADPMDHETQAVRAGNYLFLSTLTVQNGDPAASRVRHPNARDETERILEDAKGICETAGYELQDIVRARVVLRNLADWPEVDAMFKEVFGEKLPAVSVLGVGDQFVMPDCSVALDLIAAR